MAIENPEPRIVDLSPRTKKLPPANDKTTETSKENALLAEDFKIPTESTVRWLANLPEDVWHWTDVSSNQSVDSKDDDHLPAWDTVKILNPDPDKVKLSDPEVKLLTRTAILKTTLSNDIHADWLPVCPPEVMDAAREYNPLLPLQATAVSANHKVASQLLRPFCAFIVWLLTPNHDPSIVKLVVPVAK
jgi:hypothetical protein